MTICNYSILSILAGATAQNLGFLNEFFELGVHPYLFGFLLSTSCEFLLRRIFPKQIWLQQSYSCDLFFLALAALTAISS